MSAQMLRKDVVCVTGAAGYIGSWLVMRLLEQGFTVKATVRDRDNAMKTKHLTELPHAKERLTLWKADLKDEGSFDDAIDGCTGVFHVATPTEFLSQDPENDMIKPAVDGMLNILRSCIKAKTVRRTIFTSSAATVSIGEEKKEVYDDDCWSDVDFCRAKKMTAWMYFVSKTLAERAGWDFAKEHNLDFISINPTLVVGPFITPTMPLSMNAALALLTGNEAHYSILNQVQLVHLDDLCNAHIFLYDLPEAKGRYICSSADYTIYSLAALLREKYPQYNVPTQFEGIDESVKPIHLSSKKLLDLGFQYQYTVEEMFHDAIQSCQDKNLIPRPSAAGQRNTIGGRET